MAEQPYDRGGHLPPGLVEVTLRTGEEILFPDGRRLVVGDEPHHRQARTRTDAEQAAISSHRSGSATPYSPPRSVTS